MLTSIRNLGSQGQAEIEAKLSSVTISDRADIEGGLHPVAADSAADDLDATASLSAIGSVVFPSPQESLERPLQLDVVLSWQIKLIEKEISAGLLHPDAIYLAHNISTWLTAAAGPQKHETVGVLQTILSRSINICDELSILLGDTTVRELTILVSRYGLEDKKLDSIGNNLGITRERVRQIANKLEQRIYENLRKASAITIRIQTSLLIARDIGPDITFGNWAHQVCHSGLLGIWTVQRHIQVDPLHVLIAVINMLANLNRPELQVPANLKTVFESAAIGEAEQTAGTIQLIQTLPKEVKRLIRRHFGFSGCVNAKWLSRKTGLSIIQIEEMLRGLSYRPLAKEWYVPRQHSINYAISRHDVFHHSLRKMFQYCGPLGIDDICSGLRHATYRVEFPVAPPNVVAEILQLYDYKCEDGLFYWDGEIDESISSSEAVIMGCFKQYGPVVHHIELAQAFLDSDLSFPSLHRTLKCSPLFHRTGKGLYNIRGAAVRPGDIARARASQERTPVNLEVKYDTRGNVIVSASLGILAIATGVVFSEQFPNLSGNWKCNIQGEHLGELLATESEFKRLLKPFEYLGCRVGDRVCFTFNTWSREVTIEKVES